jgi:hypothetical protein
LAAGDFRVCRLRAIIAGQGPGTRDDGHITRQGKV